MEFACENCRNRYMISDDKVGAKGVKVRCRKCGHVTRVQRPAPAAGELDETQVMSTVPSPEASAEQAAASEPAASDEAPSAAASDSDDGPEQQEAPESAPASAPAERPGPPVIEPASSPSAAPGAPDPNLFAGAEDEIGAMFDSVLGGGESPKNGGAAPQEDFEQTRVVDADAMQKLVASTADGETDGDAPSESDSAVEHEWFAAIDNEQKGPFTFEALKALWDKGEIGPDSLCWRAGFADWIPLSEVSELTSRFAPTPKKPVISATAVASATAEMDGAPERGKASPGGWQPSAASALASLVQDEITALKRPAPDPAPSAPTHGGALGDLPMDPLGDAATVPRGSALTGALLAESGLPPATPAGVPGMGTLPGATPLAPEAPMGTLSHGAPLGPGTHSQAMPLNGVGHTATGPALAAPPPYAYGAPTHGRAGGSRKLVYGLIAGGGAVIVILIFVVAFLLGRDQTPAQGAVAERAPVTAPPPARTSPPAPKTTPTATASTQPATTPAAAPGKTAAPVAAKSNPAAPAPTTTPTPVPATTPEKTSAPLVAKLSPPEKAPEAPPRKVAQDTHERHHRVRNRHHRRHQEAPAAPRVAERHTHSSSSGNGADAFDAIFGGGGGGGGNSGGSARHSSKSAVYVPPAPGDEALPARLPQSAIFQVVVAHKSELQGCVQGQRKRKPGASGKVVMGWTILASGRTTRIAAETAALRSSYLAHCMTGLIRHWHFPRHKGSGQRVNFPFTF